MFPKDIDSSAGARRKILEHDIIDIRSHIVHVRIVDIDHERRTDRLEISTHMWPGVIHFFEA